MQNAAAVDAAKEMLQQRDGLISKLQSVVDSQVAEQECD